MFYFGVDYYPEQWPEERWPIDVDLMAEVGFNVVRLGDFAWSKMEPQPGQFDFTWLDRAINLFSKRGIEVVLATPTASPPPWLMDQHPQLFRVREDGLAVTFGNRREYCPSQPLYQEYSRAIVTQMAEHYAHHSAVIGWQIDNEFGERCYCPVCQKAFQAWLRKRYGSLDILNQKWGTIFWSHVYSDWAQIPVPLKTGGSPNPGLGLDFSRFASDAYVAFQQQQVEVVREKCPNHFVTHNLMGFDFDQINYFDLARELDHISMTHYPRSQWSFHPSPSHNRTALQYDTMRGLKKQNFWIMEAQVGQAGWEILSVAPRPGEVRRWSFQAIAHGADALLYFRWRSARFGTEQFWQGILDHHAKLSRRFEEIQKLGAEIRQLQDYLNGSSIKSKVAILLSYDSRFAFQIQPNHPKFSYPGHFQQLYDAFYGCQVPIDIVQPDEDLSGYDLVVAPALYVVPETTAENLKQYVRAGGVLLLTQRSGIKDEANAVVDQPFPGLLGELAGIEVEEVDSLAEGMNNFVEFEPAELGQECPEVGVICEALKTNGARVVARYTHEPYAGRPAITLHRFGEGQVVYAGAVGDNRLYDPLAKWLLHLAGVRPILETPDGVEAAERVCGDQRILFILNYTAQRQEVRLDREYSVLLGDAHVSEGTLAIGENGVAVLKIG